MSTAPKQLSKYQGDTKLIGNSSVMKLLKQKIERSALGNDNILIIGETGTGKELVARAIYDTNPRGKFVVVDCSALSMNLIESELFGHVRGSFTGAANHKIGLLEEANNGTVFFDEVGELPLEHQAKLLRVLQEQEFRPVGSTQVKKVDWKVIAATNRDLRREVQLGRFREDLYYRLNVIKLLVPPLRDRKEDIPELVSHFLNQTSSSHEVSNDVLEILAKNSWVGNVRQLQSCIKRMVALADNSVLDPTSVPATVYNEIRSTNSLIALDERGVSGGQRFGASAPVSVEPASSYQTLAEAEKHTILKMLSLCRGDRTAAASKLEIGRTTLYRKLREYGSSDSI